MNFKIKGKTRVEHCKWVEGISRSFIQNDGETIVDSQLVIKGNKALVWSFDSDTGSKEVKRETCSFTFSEIDCSNYTAANGDYNQRIVFSGKRGWDGSRQVKETLEICTFDNFETCYVYMSYFRNKTSFVRVSGYQDFCELTAESTKILQKLYSELLDK